MSCSISGFHWIIFLRRKMLTWTWLYNITYWCIEVCIAMLNQPWLSVWIITWLTCADGCHWQYCYLWKIFTTVCWNVLVRMNPACTKVNLVLLLKQEWMSRLSFHIVVSSKTKRLAYSAFEFQIISGHLLCACDKSHC